jgi:hypothetical protein
MHTQSGEETSGTWIRKEDDKRRNTTAACASRTPCTAIMTKCRRYKFAVRSVVSPITSNQHCSNFSSLVQSLSSTFLFRVSPKPYLTLSLWDPRALRTAHCGVEARNQQGKWLMSGKWEVFVWAKRLRCAPAPFSLFLSFSPERHCAG